MRLSVLSGNGSDLVPQLKLMGMATPFFLLVTVLSAAGRTLYGSVVWDSSLRLHYVAFFSWLLLCPTGGSVVPLSGHSTLRGGGQRTFDPLPASFSETGVSCQISSRTFFAPQFVYLRLFPEPTRVAGKGLLVLYWSQTHIRRGTTGSACRAR